MKRIVDALMGVQIGEPMVHRNLTVFPLIGEPVVGLELFDSSDTLRKLFAKLLRSYGLDALDRARSKPSGEEPPCTPDKAKEFLDKVAEAEPEEFPAVGEGVDIRISGGKLTGAALAAGDRVIHLSAFATNK